MCVQYLVGSNTARYGVILCKSIGERDILVQYCTVEEVFDDYEKGEKREREIFLPPTSEK